MKKGLLSILAVALTVVGCQNYDDQFDELSDQITALSATVQGLSTVADQITALQNTVNGLELTLGADIATIKTAVDALSTALDDVATASDLATISSTLADVQADVKELLAANAVINQDVTINNVATLEYVESLISTDADAPNVIVNGEITVEVDDDDFDDEHLARILAVTNKFATGLKTVTIAHTYSPTTSGPGPILTFDNLAFVDNDLSITGSTTLGDADATNDKLRTVTGDLTIANVKGGLDLSLLTSADDITVPQAVTSLRMGGVKANSIRTAGAVKGHLNLTAATVVDGGKSKVASITAPKATDIDITSAATLTVLAVIAQTIDIEGTSLNGDLSITASGTTEVHVPKVTSVGGSITTGKLAELHLDALTSVATFVSDAKVLDLSALKSQKAVGGAMAGGIILSEVTNFNAPKLDISNVVSIVKATDVTISDISTSTTPNGAPPIYALAAKNMTISALSAVNTLSFDKSATVFPALVTLSVTGKAATSSPYINTQTNKVSITSNVLTSLTTAGTIDKVNLHNAAKLTTLSTSGYVRDFSLLGAALITSAAIGHDHIEGSDAATFRISDAAKLTAVAPTSLDEVGTVTLTDLPKMTSLNLSSMVTLPILGQYSITISATGLTGSYGVASEATTTTQAYSDKIYSNDLFTLKTLMDKAAASAVVTYSFAGDVISSVATRVFDANGVPGALSTAGSAASTRTLENALLKLGGTTNAASAITTPLSEEDFAHVAAE